jgi:hypothetical protein
MAKIYKSGNKRSRTDISVLKIQFDDLTGYIKGKGTLEIEEQVGGYN